MLMSKKTFKKTLDPILKEAEEGKRTVFFIDAAHFVLDNARYQRCTTVKNLATQLNIELIFLPPYSPNLNLIERLWKFVKKQCLYSKYYSEFTKFKNSIMDCLQKTHSQYKQELVSLLTLNFQTFNKSQFVSL